MGKRKEPTRAELPIDLWVQKTRLAQGLPAHVEDRETLIKIAGLLGLRGHMQAPRRVA